MKERIYGQWAGNPKGNKEDADRCIAQVCGLAAIFSQCRNRRGKGPDGLYCGLHANQIARGSMVFTPDNHADVHVKEARNTRSVQ